MLQLFDRWDHEIQTGQDTESALVVLALCIGATSVLARAVLHISEVLPARTVETVRSLFRSSQEMLSRLGAAPFLSASPPTAILRI